MHDPRPAGPDRHLTLPPLPGALLRALLPPAERDELLADITAEYGERWAAEGAPAAGRWLRRQVLGSAPALVRWTWWRGWTGFEPRANQLRPGGPMFGSWITDLRFAARRLRTRPVYALLAVLTLALGVGGTAAIWGIARGLLFDPLPYADEAKVGMFWMPYSWSEEEFLHLRGRIPGFATVAAYRPEDVTMQGVRGAPTRLIPGLSASAELFDVLGARPILGRGFRAGDDAQGAEPVAVLSYGLWQELGGQSSIVGQRVVLDGAPRTVVGVMPRGFWFPDPSVRIWAPEPLDPEQRSGNYSFVGRTAPGQTLAAMDTPLRQLTAMLKERFEYPEQWDKTRGAEVTPVRESMMGPLRPGLLATLAAMGLILLIACANVAALMLGQVDAQSSELAVRSALGANRTRLTQQLVVEALLVGTLAGAIGALLAAAAFRMLVWALPLGAWAESAALDWGVFAAAMAIAITAALLVVLVPAASLWRGDLRGALGRARTGGIGGRGGRIEGGLVVAEVALAVLIASGAALLVRSVANLYAIDPGVDTRGVAVVDAVMGDDVEGPVRQQTVRELIAGLEAMPGVRAAAATQKLPLRGGGDNWGINIEGQPDRAPSTTAFRIVSARYFETMGIGLREGRLFQSSDRPEAETAIVVNEALAKKYFPEGNAIGQRIRNGFGAWGRIVGVVENVAEGKITDEAAPARYTLFDQIPYAPETQTLVVRTARAQDAESVLESARRTVRRVAPGVAVEEVSTMERVFATAVGPARQVMSLLMLLTALALVLGAVGIYGVISHFAARRQRDWAIRLALGLPASRVVRHIVGRGALLVGAGIVAGVAGAAALARLLASLLYGVSAVDPLALALASLALLAVGLVAAFLPARRAGLTSPALTLRGQ